MIGACGDVAGEGNKGVTQAASRLLEGLLVAIEADHGVAVTKQALGHGQPDPVGRPGDDRRPCFPGAHSDGIST